MAWRPLQVSTSASGHLPPLLISANFTKNAYTVHLTDLTHIWGESLDRGAIIRRSREEGTSIDPSEGDQFQIFIEKIKLGLGGGHGTTLALTVNSDTDRPSLTLRISVALPGGLAPLAWQVRLQSSPQTLFTNQFIIPLLEAQHVQMQEAAILAKVLKDKDHVIQKLMDRLESQNPDFHDLFPQPGGRGVRKVDRKQAEEKVKGLGVFDLATWKESLNLKVSQDPAHLIGQVFADNEVEAVSSLSVPDESQENWWQGIRGITVNLGSGKISTNGSTDKPTTTSEAAVKRSDTVEDDDDAFQVQSLPAHLARSVEESAPKDDNSTDDEDNLDAPSQRSKIPDSYPAESTPPLSPKPKKKLGGIGGKKMAGKTKPPIHDDASTADEDEPPRRSTRAVVQEANKIINTDDESTEDMATPSKLSLEKKSVLPVPEKLPAKPVRKLGKIGGKKEPPPPSELELESESESAHLPAEPKPPSEAVNPKRGKLGIIGGKKTVVDSEQEPKAVSAPTPEYDTASPTKKRTLGAIGGHKHGTTETKVEEPAEAKEESQDSGIAENKSKTQTTRETRETSIERANRRRVELKKELEQKAKAPPKKKRKF